MKAVEKEKKITQGNMILVVYFIVTSTAECFLTVISSFSLFVFEMHQGSLKHYCICRMIH